jgi:hypothetical protein
MAHAPRGFNGLLELVHVLVEIADELLVIGDA